MHTETETPTHHKDCDDARHRAITVKVNRKSVQFRQRRVTGAEIKAAAIAQGVPIQPDFVLFLVLGPGQRKVIGDDDHVTLRKDSCFEAIPCDDNS
jgi:multiubiquitin